jgi:uncharacterized protein (UPF0332 family)
MEKYILQAEHNLRFLKEINANFPLDFFDWKITIAFYTAIHLTKALLLKRIGKEFDNHEQINATLSHRRNPKSPVKEKYWKAYMFLYDESQKVRYTGFTNDSETLKAIQARDYEEVVIELTYIIKATKTDLTHQIVM